MKNYFTIVRKHAGVYQFIALFYLAMGMSKYTQILFFQKHAALLNYSFSYSAMALAGSCAFLIANNLKGWSLQKIVRKTLPLYALGMFLRVFPQSTLLAILSGTLSGLGASLTLLVIRTWLYALSDRDPTEKEQLISARYTLVQVCSLGATVLSGGVLASIGKGDVGYLFLLSVSAGVMAFLGNAKIDTTERITPQKKGFVYLPEDKLQGLALYLSVLFLGLANALVGPIVAAILRDLGLTVFMTTLVTSAFSLITLGVAFFYQSPRSTKYAARNFCLNQSVLLVGLLSYLLFFPNKFGALLVFTVGSFTLAGFFILRELMEYAMFPKNETLIYLGLVQSAFLVGDALGSPFGTSIYTSYGLKVLFSFYAVMLGGSTLAYSVIYYYLKKKNVAKM